MAMAAAASSTMDSSRLYQRTERSDAIVATASVMLALCLVAVLLRFCGMYVTKTHRFGWDDGFVLLSLPFIITLNSLFIWSASEGILGGRLDGISEAVLSDLQKFNYAAQLLFQCCISIPKFACLAFYYRVFGRSSKKFYTALWVASFLAVSWLIIALFVEAFQCSPARKAWEFRLPGHCIAMWPMFVGLAVSSMVIDVFILVMPLPLLWQMNVALRRKITVSLIFICGYCVVICSIGRVATLGSELLAFMSPEPLYDTAPYFCWISTEGPVSVIGVCLPIIFKFFKRIHEHRLSSGYTSQKSPDAVTTPYDNQYNRHRHNRSDKSGALGSSACHPLRPMSRTDLESWTAATPCSADENAKQKQNSQLDMA